MWKAPCDISGNKEYRVWLGKRAQQSKRKREAIVERCSHDIHFYVNSFVWTFDPRTKGKLLPFVTWPIQDLALVTILDCITEGRDLVIEKSRDMGASWLSLVCMEWLWHFQTGNSFLMVSRKEDLVDAPGDPDSLFWKLDFVHRHLPDWLRPSIDRRKLHFENLDNTSTIDGESTTAAAGVGGRRTAMFIDEFSRIEEGYQLLAGTADTTRCRIFNFTPFGTSNAAYKLARRGDIRKLRLHWSDHPEKAKGLYKYDERKHRVERLDPSFVFAQDFNFIMDGRLRSPWYDAECERRANDREVAQMLDIDYQGSSYQFFDKSLIANLQSTYCVSPFWDGDISFDPDTARPRGLIRTAGGLLKLWCNLDAHDKPPVSTYVGGADIATGTGATNSCLSLVDAKTGEKVLEYASPYLRPEDFAMRVVAICHMFLDKERGPPLLAWEQQGPGMIFGKKVLEVGYRHVYYRRDDTKLYPKDDLDSPGWFPSQNNKRILMEDYRAGLSTRQMLNRSTEALEECMSFIHTKQGFVEHSDEQSRDDPSGARSNHGDRVIADALAWKMCRQLGMMASTKKQESQEVKVGSLAWRREYAHNDAKNSGGWS